MKKVLTIATVIGLVAVPSAAMASHRADDPQTTPSQANVQREDHQANRPNDDAVVQAADNQGQVRDQVDNDNDDNDQTPPANPTTGLTLAQAEAIAQNQLPNKTIARAELENEEGIQVFSVRFSDGSRVDVDASTGAIVRTQNQSQTQTNNSGPGHAEDNHNSGRGHDN